MNKINDEKIIILDFGGQYTQLIARRVRECNVFCEIYPYNVEIEKIKELAPKGIIFAGGPNSAYVENAPTVSRKWFELNIPIFGICYGAQLIIQLLGGKIDRADVGEYGKAILDIIDDSKLFKSCVDKNICFMSHNDYIKEIAPDFKIIASTKDCPIAAFENSKNNIFGVQFHPEVVHTIDGMKIFKNFVVDICKCKCSWKMEDFAKNMINTLKNKIGDAKVLCALSGGVDSTVAAVLLSKAVGKNLSCIFVDHGLLRKNEAKEIEGIFGKDGKYKLNFIKVDARDRFYAKLKGIIEPEEKRKIIGEEFIRVFEEEAKKLGRIDYFVQGTIYPDVVESGIGNSATIKSHHNVGGLPEHIDFKELVEPLRMLFKDEVRDLGLVLGIDSKIISRQPFPGPGLGVRIIGEVTEEKVRIVQDCDFIFREEIKAAGWDKKIAQYFAALSNMKSVGVSGDLRTYDYAIILRAVNTVDFMTAEATEIPFDILQRCMNRILNEVKGVNRVMYDLTSKPPGTIEFE